MQEKLDGSCVAVACIGGELLALGREGWRAELSENPGRRMFARWVKQHSARFSEVLREGEWMVGEWLALAHSTRYQLSHEPFVVFDLCSRNAALSTSALEARLGSRFARLLDPFFDDPTWGQSRGSRGKWKSYRKKAPWVTFTLHEALAEVRAALLRPT